MSDTTIDFSSIEADVQGMSKEELAEFVLKTRVKQKVAQKKYYNPDTAKAQRQRAAARQRAAIEALKAMPAEDGQGGTKFDELERKASALAQAELDSDNE